VLSRTTTLPPPALDGRAVWQAVLELIERAAIVETPNRTTDDEISDVTDAEDRVVVSKDSDFRDSHLISGTPRKLLVVTAGNIKNQDLLQLLDEHLGAIVSALESADLVELGRTELTVHDRF
jgi:predicted nuclease of predicted toxin-antitoxin system